YYVTECRYVRAPCCRWTEKQTDLWHPSRHFDLIVKNSTCSSSTRKHMYLICNSSPCRINKVQHWHFQFQGGFLDADDFLYSSFPPRTSLHSRIIGHHTN